MSYTNCASNLAFSDAIYFSANGQEAVKNI